MRATGVLTALGLAFVLAFAAACSDDGGVTEPTGTTADEGTDPGSQRPDSEGASGGGSDAETAGGSDAESDAETAGGSDAESDPESGLRDAGDEPDDPGNKPVDPGDKPADPGTEPADPGTEPADPGTEPADPGTEPTDAGPPPSRWIDLQGVMNTRDLGGWPLAGGKQIRWRVLVRSGHLAGVDSAGCTTLEEIGLATVIDLRDGADLDNADAQCVLDQARYEVASMPKLLPPSPETYTQTLELSGASIRSIFSILAEPNTLPALYHCVIGRDRVNVVTALIMLALGASRETVLAEYALSNDIGMSVDADWLEPVFEKVSGAGGIDAYLGSLGVTADELATLRAAAVE